MKKLLVFLTILCLLIGCTEDGHFKSSGKTHYYTIGIGDPYIFFGRMPRNKNLKFKLTINKKSTIISLPITNILITDGFNVYIMIETDREKQSGEFKGNAMFTIETIQAECDFALFIDGKLVETGFNNLKYLYHE